MFKKRAIVVVDEGLHLIDAYEAAIIAAHDEKVSQGADAADVERERPAVVALAKAITDRMREEWRSRQS